MKHKCVFKVFVFIIMKHYWEAVNRVYPIDTTTRAHIINILYTNTCFNILIAHPSDGLLDLIIGLSVKSHPGFD